MSKLIAFFFLAASPLFSFAQNDTLLIPRLEEGITIDGNLVDWREVAFTDGLWDMRRIMQSPWYDGGKRNRLADHGFEPNLENDLNARYFIAWDEKYLYLGAEVEDNQNDVTESKHAPKRWYYKDAICWFFEAPADTIPDTFSEGCHGFAFVIDTTYPEYGAWWRHGTDKQSFIEEQLPEEAVEYAIRFNKQRSHAGYTLEARIDLSQTFATGDPAWETPEIGKFIKMMIVHTDPDGGEYGGHMLIYGAGDPDNSWHVFQLGDAIKPVVRKPK